MVCPQCETDLGPNNQSAAGHQIRGVYDGVLFWSCPSCGYAWPRFTDEVVWGRRAQASAEEAARWNREMATIVREKAERAGARR